MYIVPIFPVVNYSTFVRTYFGTVLLTKLHTYLDFTSFSLSSLPGSHPEHHSERSCLLSLLICAISQTSLVFDDSFEVYCSGILQNIPPWGFF